MKNQKLDKTKEELLLSQKGLTDKNAIESLIRFKQSHPEASKKKLPTEMYDKVNLMCRKYMDRMAHFEIAYDFEVDEAIFKNVTICALEAAPVFHSSVVRNPIAPYWKNEFYHIDEVVFSKHTSTLERDKSDFFASEIPLSSNVQIKIALFYSLGKTYICLKWNHMCMDGGGFKAFWNDFCKCYSEYATTGKMPMFFSSGSRKYTDVYKDFDKKTASRAKKQFANISPRDKHRFPFKNNNIEKDAIIVSKTVDADVFKNAVKYAKNHGATVNDLLIATYITALSELAGFKSNESISVSSAVDLRRYIKDLSSIGYTNHVSFIHCAIPKIGDNFEETLSLVNEKMKAIKKDEFMGLHGLPLLNIGYKSMVYLQAETVVKLFYRNPTLSVSNLGAIDTVAFSLGGNEPFSAFSAGAAKNKPCAVMTALSINGTLCVSICLRGNDSDRRLLEEFFDKFEIVLKSL